MFDSFIIGALTALVLGGFYFLFKKPTKKIHAYIQIAVLGVLALILFICFISALTTLGDEFAVLVLPVMIVIVPGEIFVIYRLYTTVQCLKNNEFEK